MWKKWEVMEEEVVEEEVYCRGCGKGAGSGGRRGG